MNKKMLLVLICLAPTLWASPAKPERIAVGRYSVPAERDQSWTVAVQEAKGVVSFELLDKTVSLAIHLMVFRVALPVEAATADAQDLAAELVRNDGLKYQMSMFQRQFQFPRRTETVECEAGKAFVFGNDEAVFTDGVTHYAKAALLLPPDYRTRRIGYLLVGHQVRRATRIGLEQDEQFYTLLKGLREVAANHTSEPTQGAVH